MVTALVGDLGPGVNRTATAVGMTGEAGRVVTFTDQGGSVLTCVTSGEVVYAPNPGCFYNVVTPVSAEGFTDEQFFAFYDNSADYIIEKIPGGYSLGDIRHTDIRAFK